MGKRKKNDRLDVLLAKREKSDREEAAETLRDILPRLVQDPEWKAATEKTDRAWDVKPITRITKKVVRALYPDHAVSVRRGSGTAHSWVYVDIRMPELEGDLMKRDQCRAVCRRVKNALRHSGIRYATYYTDHGANDSHEPCLLVRVNNRA